MGEPLIALAGISREFPSGEGTIAVLRDIGLEIHAGEFVAIMGPSGSGKSTLINIWAALTGHRRVSIASLAVPRPRSIRMSKRN